MADTRIPSLNLLTDPASDDLLLIVDDVSNNPVNKKITLQSLFTNFELMLEVIGKSLVRRDISVRRDINLRNETTVEQPTSINVSGLNDIETNGTYVGTSTTQFDVEIDATGTPDTFKWRKDGGSYTSGVSITGGHVTLSGGDGVTVKFKATTGHTVGDRWTFAALPLSKIDFGQGQVLQEDEKPSSSDFSEEGFLTLESGVDIKLESGATKDLSITANTTVISINGDVKLGSSSDKVGFFGTTPVSQNTSMTSASATQVRDELIRLGIFS